MFSRLNQTFAFHSSPEAFISSRLEAMTIDNSELLAPNSPHERQGVIQASILNRNVHIVSSYRLCRAILQHSSSVGGQPSGLVSCLQDTEHVFTVGPAYTQLMSAFFPAPNLLLEDGETHAFHKSQWMSQVGKLPSDAAPIVRPIATRLIRTKLQPDRNIDLYNVLKSFSWDCMLGIFLGLDSERDGKAFSEVESAQEDLLRGQFSLFPVPVATPFWSSTRSKGLKAVSRLQQILKERVHLSHCHGSCPYLSGHRHINDVNLASHCLLFTSSIVNKAISSLLTAYMLNIFLGENEGQSLASLLRQHPSKIRQAMLRSILLETERLSPPVIGVMRRVAHDVTLKGAMDGGSPSIIPAGHDIWLYFSKANRDEMVFKNAGTFVWNRFMKEDSLESVGLAFGDGAKSCLGNELVRQICLIVAQEFVDSGIDLTGDIQADGLKAWLGWVPNVDPAVLARDMKQLPCQRPREPVTVRIRLPPSASDGEESSPHISLHA